MEATKSMAERLLAVDVSNHTEKKGKHTYLSWPFAVAELIKADPGATFGAVRFPLPANPTVLVPWMETPLGFFVEVEVRAGGVTRSQIHPVLNANNQPIAKPTAFEINTSIQRALVKAIALHGLGLNVYAGEDLPIFADDADDTEAPRARPQAAGHRPRTDEQTKQMTAHMAALAIPNDKRGAFIDTVCLDGDAVDARSYAGAVVVLERLEARVRAVRT